MGKQGVGGICRWENTETIGDSPNDISEYGWGASLVDGSPGDPIYAGILGFTSTDGASVDPAPFGSPTFLGLSFISVEAGLGFAVCTGPAPDASGPTEGYVDNTDLTVLDSWYVASDDDHAISAWFALTEGVYYYIVVEQYADEDTFKSFGVVVDGAAVAGIGYFDVLYLDTSQIGLVGLPVVAPIDVEFVPGPATLEIDWGDGHTTTRTDVVHSDEDLTYDIVDDYYSSGTFAATINHTYATRGLYTVTATITDGQGTVTTASVLIAQVRPPTCHLTVTPHATRLPGKVMMSVSGHSDAWDLMKDRDADTNPDGYDPTSFSAAVGTNWEVLANEANGYTAADYAVFADWFGSGVPTNDQTPSLPPPTHIYYPADTHNKSMRDARPTQPDIVFLAVRDNFHGWEQDATATVHVKFVKTLPRLRQWPRDDALGGQPRQDKSQISTQASARQGWTNAYR